MFKKLKKLAKKAFSSKTYLLLTINKMVPDNLGEVIDISVDREAQHLFVAFAKGIEKANLTIEGYGIEYEGKDAYLIFDTIRKEGYLKSMLKGFHADKRIKVDPKYLKLIEKMV